MERDAPNNLDVGLDSVVYVIDNEDTMLDAISSLLRSVGFTVQTFSCAEDFFAAVKPDIATCLILDVRLNGQSGFAVHKEMAARCISMPVIFVTAYADIMMSVKAMKSGASDFLVKPFRDQDMFDAVSKALADDKDRREAERTFSALLQCFETLTVREREVTELVTSGLVIKQIASRMNISELTVKIHRSRAMKKMQSRSLADFVLKANAVRRSLGSKALA
jgi:RNA polymerase sigma factor (sigma-70 family)